MGGRTTVVVGHYKRASRTSRAARHLGSMLANDSAPSVIELADHRDVLLSDPGNPGLVSVKEEVARSSVVVIASPTYKGTYTGILKLFLEQFPGGSGLEGVLVVPMMMCGSAAHAMAAEVFLKPLLVELGATCPTGAVVLSEDENGWGAHLSSWIVRWGPTVLAASSAGGTR